MTLPSGMPTPSSSPSASGSAGRAPAAPAAPAASTASAAPAALSAHAPRPGTTAADETLAALAELIATVDHLRDPERGCPWDLEQTHASLIPFVLEEAHEVADAIRHGDDRHLEEELGDLLLQVLLHARLASEEGSFSLATVARGIHAKLVRRHPHVFGEGTGQGMGAARRGRGADPAAVQRSWEAIKEQERVERARGSAAEAPGGAEPDGSGGPSGVAAGSGKPGVAAGGADSPSPLSDRLAGKVRGQPALAGAMTISKKAAAAGFEWDDLAGVWQKVHEELDELKEAVASGDRGHAQEELGDVLFTLVNVARWCGIDPEEGLVGTNRRFLDRFARVEAALDGDLRGRSLRELEVLWRAAKAQIRAEAEQA